jgi:hypothetical protein
MYGFNSPQGFVPIRSDNNSILGASLRTMPIKNAYGTSIFTGDPVIWAGAYAAQTIGTAGYMISLWDFINNVTNQTTDTANENGGGAPLLGIFQGVKYVSPTDTVSPATPIRPYWPGGTSTANGQDAVGYFVPCNYEYGFTCQTLLTAPAATMVGKFTRVSFSVTGTAVNGNTVTGQSMCSVDLARTGAYTPWANPATPNTAFSTFLIEDIDYSEGTSGATVPYGNVVIRLCNTAYPFFYDHA